MRKFIALITVLFVLGVVCASSFAGEAIQLRNNSTYAMAKGTLVKLGTRNQTIVPTLGNATQTGTIGAIVDTTCARTALCWVCTDGICDVLRVDNTAANMGQLVRIGLARGRADVAGTQGGRNQTIGYTIESKASGNGTVRVLMRVN